MITGCQVADTLLADLGLNALEMAIWSRGDRIGAELGHHSGRGVHYTSIRYTQRAAGAVGVFAEGDVT